MSATITARQNVPEEIIIGTQTWMKKNHDFSGSPYDDDSQYVPVYGKLCTWAEALAIDIEMWHVPTKAEYETLITYLGGGGVAGGHLKEAGTTHWLAPNTGADNSSGFTGVPMYPVGSTGIYWTLTEYAPTTAYVLFIETDDDDAEIDGTSVKTAALSVRLIKGLIYNVYAEIRNATPNIIFIYFSNILNINPPDETDFTVSASGGAVTATYVAILDATEIGHGQFYLNLSRSIAAGETVTVTYTVPEVNPLQDNYGNLVLAFSNFAVTNKVT